MKEKINKNSDANRMWCTDRSPRRRIVRSILQILAMSSSKDIYSELARTALYDKTIDQLTLYSSTQFKN